MRLSSVNLLAYKESSIRKKWILLQSAAMKRCFLFSEQSAR